jgi:hypothetical protein
MTQPSDSEIEKLAQALYPDVMTKMTAFHIAQTDSTAFLDYVYYYAKWDRFYISIFPPLFYAKEIQRTPGLIYLGVL